MTWFLIVGELHCLCLWGALLYVLNEIENGQIFWTRAVVPPSQYVFQ